MVSSMNTTEGEQHYTDIGALVSKYRSQLMGFSALWIWIFHVWMKIFKASPVLFLQATENFIVETGFCGVDIFFFLSGMGLIYAIEKKNYFYRRFIRILPAHLIMAIFFKFVYQLGIKELLLRVIGYRFLFESVGVYLWFNFAIAIFYLLFPLYYRFFIKAEDKVTFTAASLVIWLFCSIVLRDIMREDLFGVTNRIPVFLLGVLFGYVRKNKQVLFYKSHWILCGLCLVCGVYLSYLTNFEDFYLVVELSNCCIPNLFMGISLLFLIPKALDMLNIKLLKSALGFLGNISLELYCVYKPVETVIKGFLKPLMPRIVCNIVVLITGVLLAYILRCIGKWIAQLLEKNIKGINNG